MQANQPAKSNMGIITQRECNNKSHITPYSIINSLRPGDAYEYVLNWVIIGLGNIVSIWCNYTSQY